jgi:NAD(P)-dependent dehydrogenase (short-subunit alcohol dehydrogenase family)
MPIELAGRRVLVVGASSGIGAAIAKKLGDEGARVAVTARRADRLQALADTLPGSVALPADLRDEGAVRQAVGAAVEAFGGLDAAIYTAATSPLVPMAEATAADWREVLETNLVGAALVAASAAPHLVASGGRLVILSSKAVRQPFADLGLYVTSKAALEGLIRCLPVEFPGLLVTRVVVGNTHSTDFASSWDAEALTAALGRWTAAGVLGSMQPMHPDDVADAVLTVLTSAAHIDDLAVLDRPPAVDETARGPE